MQGNYWPAVFFLNHFVVEFVFFQPFGLILILPYFLISYLVILQPKSKDDIPKAKSSRVFPVLPNWMGVYNFFYFSCVIINILNYIIY